MIYAGLKGCRSGRFSGDRKITVKSIKRKGRKMKRCAEMMDGSGEVRYRLVCWFWGPAG